jgi:hypothetical protein
MQYQKNPARTAQRAGRFKRLAIVDAAKRTGRLAAEASTFNLQVIHTGREVGLPWSMRSVAAHTPPGRDRADGEAVAAKGHKEAT